MADKPAEETTEDTSADAIEKSSRRRKRDVEERVSWLEDENKSLKDSNKTLEKQLGDICKTMKVPASKADDKDFWQSLSDALGF